MYERYSYEVSGRETIVSCFLPRCFYQCDQSTYAVLRSERPAIIFEMELLQNLSNQRASQHEAIHGYIPLQSKKGQAKNTSGAKRSVVRNIHVIYRLCTTLLAYVNVCHLWLIQ